MPSRPSLAAGFAAFAAGWSVMSLEILNGRLMAPAFGQTIYQWGALIGTALAFMAAGYWVGGRLWARGAASTALPLLLWAASLCAASAPWVGRWLAAYANAQFGPLAGALLTAAALLGLPAFALAAVSPLCVAILAKDGDAAPACGAVSALGSLGSIGGTFFAAFFAVPYIGLTAGYASAALIAVVAALFTGLQLFKATAVLLPLGFGIAAQRHFAASFLSYAETPYNTVMVSQTPDAVLLSLNSPDELQSMRRKDGGPTGQYWDTLAAVPALAKGRSVLLLGVAGGSAVAATLKAWPGIQVLGVELDPGVTAMARRYFNLAIPVVTADARRFIDQDGPKFDVVIIDLYATGQIPAYVATREFYVAVSRRLRPGGVVALNVFGAADLHAVLSPLTATLAAVFPGLLAANAGGSNTILLAWNQAVDLGTVRAMLTRAPPAAWMAAMAMLANLADPNVTPLTNDILTDDRSDLELRAAKAQWPR